jgi:hypothetical protein
MPHLQPLEKDGDCRDPANRARRSLPTLDPDVGIRGAACGLRALLLLSNCDRLLISLLQGCRSLKSSGGETNVRGMAGYDSSSFFYVQPHIGVNAGISNPCDRGVHHASDKLYFRRLVTIL